MRSRVAEDGGRGAVLRAKPLHLAQTWVLAQVSAETYKI